MQFESVTIRGVLTILGMLLKLLLVAAVGALVLTDVIWESYGVPDSVAAKIRARAAEAGVELEAASMRLGVVRGLVLEQARIRWDRQPVPVSVASDVVRIQPELGPLLQRRIELRSATFEGADATLYPDGTIRDAPDVPVLTLKDVSGTVRPTPDGGLDVHVQGLFEKIRLDLDGDISGLDRIAHRTPAATGSPAAGPRAQRSVSPHPLRDVLLQLRRLLDQLDLAERDAFISGKLAVDAADPAHMSVDAEFGVADILLRGLIVRKAKGRAAYADGTLSVSDVAIFVGGDEVVTGDLTCQVDSQRKRLGEVSGVLQGDLRPRTLYRLLDRPEPSWLKQATLARPVSLNLSVAGSSIRPADWTVRGDLKADEITVRGVRLHGFESTVSWQSRVLNLALHSARLGSTVTPTVLSGDVTWDSVNERLSGEADAQLQLPALLSSLGVFRAAPWLGSLVTDGPVAVRAVLAPSPVDWRRWTGGATLACDGFSLGGRSVTSLNATLEAKRGTVRIETLTLGMPNAPDNALSLNGTVDLTEVIARRTLPFTGTLAAMAPPVSEGNGTETPLGDWERGLELKLTADYAVEGGALNVQADGWAFPGRLYHAYETPLGLPRNRSALAMRCQSTPAQITLTLTNDAGKGPLKLQAHASANDAQYKDLQLDNARADITVTPSDVRFSNIQGTTRNGDAISLDIAVRYQPLRVTLSNGTLHGSPRVVGTFIDNRAANAIYSKVWKEIDWSSSPAPAIKLESLVYRQPSPGVWHLSMDAGLAMKDVSFRGFTSRDVSATVLLDLPGTVTVKDVRVRTSSGQAEGMITITTGQVPTCTFEIGRFEGGVEPRQVLHAINPAWDDWLEPFAFSPTSAFSCRGSFYLSREPRLRLAGTIESPYLEYKGLRLADPAVSWTLDGKEVHWDLSRGTLFGGDAQVTGTYDTHSGQGLVAFRGNSMRLAGIIGHLGQKGDDESERHPGLVSGQCRLQILNNWAGSDVQLAGNGILSITEADLWRVPLFSKLGALLDVTLLSKLTGGKASSLGKITRLDADLTFNGDRIQIPSLTTNGTIISLNGQGEYAWGSDQLYLSVTGEALRRINVISLVFRPLSWVFSAELVGTSKDYKWQLSTPLNRAFSGDSEGAGRRWTAP